MLFIFLTIVRNQRVKILKIVQFNFIQKLIIFENRIFFQKIIICIIVSGHPYCFLNYIIYFINSFDIVHINSLLENFFSRYLLLSELHLSDQKNYPSLNLFQ